MTRIRTSAAISLAVASMLGAACGSSSDTAKKTSEPGATPASSAAAATTAAATSPAAGGDAGAVTIKDFKYAVPGPAGSGAKVTVTNNDTTEHTVTADGDGGFDVKVGPGKTATFDAPAKAGTFAFHCEIHPQMKGELKVT